MHGVAMAIVTNLEAAHRQLRTAVRMYFQDDDAVSIHTLACAAREIYERRCKSEGADRMFEHMLEANPHLDENGLWNTLNHQRNFFKHPVGEGKPDGVEIDDETNAAALFIASYDCCSLCRRDEIPPAAAVFNGWYLAVKEITEAGASAEEVERAKTCVSLFEQSFPGLRVASKIRQKKLGLDLLQWFESGCKGPQPVLPD
jgi:hypothetical protein